MYPRAIQDIDDIYAYIALVKQAPETAREQTDRIWNAIDTLEDCRSLIRIGWWGDMPGKGINSFLSTTIWRFLRLLKQKK